MSNIKTLLKRLPYENLQLLQRLIYMCTLIEIDYDQLEFFNKIKRRIETLYHSLNENYESIFGEVMDKTNNNLLPTIKKYISNGESVPDNDTYKSNTLVT